MANLRPILVSFLLVGLFAIALISAGIFLADANGSNQSIANDPTISQYISSLNESLRTSSDVATSAEDAVGDSPITLSSTSNLPVFDTIAKIWKTLKTVPITVYNLTVGLLFSKVLGNESFAIVTAIIAAILTLTIIIAVVKLLSTGEGG